MIAESDNVKNNNKQDEVKHSRKPEPTDPYESFSYCVYGNSFDEPADNES